MKNANERPCENCGKIRSTHVVERKEELPVRGEPTEVPAKVRICDECGTSLYDEELDTATLKEAFGKYRAKHGIVSPDEISELREKYGLSQRSLGRLLGWGEVTITRYEQGSLPDEAHNQMLKMLKDEANFRRIYEENKARLSDLTRRRVESRLHGTGDDSDHCMNYEELIYSLQIRKPGIFNGFRSFSLDTLQEMIVFYTSRIKDVSITKLNKLLFYADFIHYRLHSVSISGTKYVHVPYGPVPDGYLAIIELLEKEDVIRIDEEPFYQGRVVSAKKEPDFASLPGSALQALEQVCDFFGNKSAKEVSEISHNEAGYRETEQGKPISYAYADKISLP
jgi:putative zinc finger/helix-turn-helix YgiT family protein